MGQTGKKKELRFVRNVGLGFKTPKEVLRSVVTTVNSHYYGHHWGHDLLSIIEIFQDRGCNFECLVPRMYVTTK